MAGKKEEKLMSAPSLSVKSPSSYPTVSFLDFIDLIRNGNAPDAAVVLTQVFGLSLNECQDCTQIFLNKFNQNEALALQKVLQVKKELRSGSYNAAQMLLYDCFGIQGLQAICALETIRRNPEAFQRHKSTLEETSLNSGFAQSSPFKGR